LVSIIRTFELMHHNLWQNGGSLVPTLVSPVATPLGRSLNIAVFPTFAHVCRRIFTVSVCCAYSSWVPNGDMQNNQRSRK